MTNLPIALKLITSNILFKDEVAAILAAALRAADPFDAVTCNLSVVGDILTIGGKKYSRTPEGRIVVVALGKAAPAMLEGAFSKLGGLIQRGVCVSKHPVEAGERVRGIDYVQGNHPVPGDGSLAAGRAIKETVVGLTEHDLVLVLLSGGGSALATLPVEGVTLVDMQELTSTLLRSGADINQMNAVRKHLDVIKGGGLLRLAAPASVSTLVLSDVVGNHLDVIASGPTYPDTTTFTQALEVVKRAHVSGDIPVTILEYLEKGTKGQVPETVRPGNALAVNVNHTIIGSNLESCQAAVQKAREFSFYAELVTTNLVGEAREAGQSLAEIAKERLDLPRPYVLVFGGETTVTITGSGKGGRNQEVALGALKGMAGQSGTVLITLATDGEDGPTDAAGAVVDGTSLTRANRLGLDSDAYLVNNDAYTFFKQMRDLLVIGPTGTNVNDISFIFGF